MEKQMKIAGIQVGAYQGSYEVHINKIVEVIKQVVDLEKPKLIVLSELMTAPYFAAVPTHNDTFFSYAEYLNGPTVQTIQKIANETNTHIVGTLFEKERLVDATKNYYNTAFVCSPTRGLLGSYRKVHIPKVCVDNMICDEKYYFEQFGGGGKEFPVFTLDNGIRMGILICFDRTFPESWRALSMQGTDLVVVPTATYGFRKNLYVDELKVRALENNIYVMGVNKAGKEQLPGEIIPREHFGLSCISNPFGELMTVGPEDEWSYIVGDMQCSEIEKSKERVDWLAERKEHIYKQYISTETSDVRKLLL